jgi:5'-nucleotidase
LDVASSVLTELRGKKINILVTNDDGAHALGLWTLVEELVTIGKVLVVAPDREQSGVGTSVTLHRPLRVKELRPHVAGVKAYSVEGTPADCVILGLHSLSKEKIDLVVSGINEGANLGNDVLISGTVGAAMQAYFNSVPAIAISVAELRDPIFGPAAKLAAVLGSKLAAAELPAKSFFNVNLPNIPLNQLKGVAVTRLGERSYVDSVEEHVDTRGKSYYWIVRGNAEWDMAENSDIWALRQGLASITPLQSDVASASQLISLAQLTDSIFEALMASSKTL